MLQLKFTWPTDKMTRSFRNGRGGGGCPWYTRGGKTNGKNLEHRMNIYCFIARSFSDWLRVHMLWRNRVTLNGAGGSRKGENMCRMTQEVGSQNREGQETLQYEYNVRGRTANQQCWQCFWYLFGGQDPDSGLTSGFYTTTMTTYVHDLLRAGDSVANGSSINMGYPSNSPT
jgi:hypothetical protein